MEDEEKKGKVFSYSKLESRSYRYLQQLAKSLELPANFKKMYLIELILAKKFKTQVEVDSIIQRVKIERLQIVCARKEWLRRKKNVEKINKSSPPITTTPKRFTYSPEMRTVLTYNSKRSLVRNINENKSSSDRVLRSFDIKTLKPNYAVMNMSDDNNTVPKETKIKIITNGGFPQISLTAKCVVTRHKPSILSSSGLKRPLMLTQTSGSLQPPKRKRTLSGIYPILQESVPRHITTDNVCLRKVDGSLTKINALVQKRNMNVIPIQKNNYRNQEINIQDIIDGFDGGDDQNYLQIQYPNMSSLETNNTPQMPTESYNENIPDLYSVYYHKKIRAEQIRCQKIKEMPESQRLPNINDVFSQFNNINRKDFSMPLYVQVSTESERSQSYAYHVPHNNSNTITLETYFNFKNQQITNTPLLQLATTSNTKCVYSTPLISTAMVHPSTVVSEACTSDSHRLDDMYEFLQFTESTLRRYSDEGPSTPSSQCSQDVSTCSIPEMVEDAMDIIRRDGNYMQQIETEKMQCALCACAGTRGSIEGHVRRDHSSQILPSHSERVSFQLAAAGAPWTSAALERGGALYILSLRCLRDCLEGSLASLSPDPEQKFGTITIYNKLTGEPFAWNGPIPPLSPNLPYENETSCIKISLSKLDLFPNSANLKLINREFVSDLTTKVVVGQTPVNDIDIDVFFILNVLDVDGLRARQVIYEALIVDTTPFKTFFLHTMSQFVQPYQPPRQKIPKDGPGPRGVPEVYYTSRVLNSTFRYVKFVRKLRAEEEDQRKGAENKLKELKDKQNSDFFIRCDRRSLINNVARRVDLCLASYQQDLKQKQKRLIDLYAHEEESNIRKFVVQAQAGAESVWNDKMNRLQYLLDKRKKEHEEKYKDSPLSRCVHVLPCIYKLRAKEAEEIQLYQIKEKQARKMAEIEFDKMWHEVAMKESDALAARMEVDVIERLRRDLECKDSTDKQLEQRKIQREKEREWLKEEAKRFKAIWDEDIRKDQEAEAKATEKRMATAMERKQMIEDRHRVLQEAAQAHRLVADTWDALTAQGQTDIKERELLRRRKERELDICNKNLLELKKQYLDLENINEAPLAEEARKRQEYTDMKRCEYLAWAQKTNRDVRKAMIDQIKDREEARKKLKQKIQEQDEYHKQLFGQLEQLVDHKQITDAQKRKEHQKNLLDQIEYNKMLKERARQEELDEIKKCQAASEEYQEEIKRMLCRPFFSDEVHPFMKQLAKGLSMKEKCPCSKPDYCK